MPIYDFKCKKCENTWDEMLLYKNRDKPCKSGCPKCAESGMIERVIGAPIMSEPHKMGLKRPDSGFREVISKIKQHHPKNTIRDY